MTLLYKCYYFGIIYKNCDSRKSKLFIFKSDILVQSAHIFFEFCVGTAHNFLDLQINNYNKYVIKQLRNNSLSEQINERANVNRRLKWVEIYGLLLLQTFITNNMDASFVEPPPFDLHSSFLDSSPTTPLVFLLSAGSDPMASLFMYAKTRNMYDK